MGEDLNDALIEALTPLVRALVDDAVRRARVQWQWATVRQAAELLDTSETAIRSRIERKQIPAKKIDGRIYVNLAELDSRLRSL